MASATLCGFPSSVWLIYAVVRECILAKETVCHNQPCFWITFGVMHLERFEVRGWKLQLGNSDL